MTCAEAIARVVRLHGPSVVFGYPGAHTVRLHAAVSRERGLRHVLVRHEQAAGFAADAYARVSGGVGAFITTAGPGATNSVTAVTESFTNSIPTVHICTQVDTPFVGGGLGAWHEADIEGIFRPVTKWNHTAQKARDVPALVLRSLREAASGRPRPTQVCIPRDLLEGEVDTPGAPVLPASRPQGDASALTAAARALSACERPVIIAGGGAQGASAALGRLARTSAAGVATTCMGKGAFPDDDPLCLGPAWGDAASVTLAEADLCLAVGCRFTQITTRNWTVSMPSTLVHIDIDPHVIAMHYPASVPVVADAAAALGAIEAEVIDRDRRQWRTRIAELREARRAVDTPEARLSRALRRGIPRECLLVGDVASLVYHMFSHFDVYRPRSFIYPAGYIAMGYGLPAALGAHLARPDRPVLCIAGDGSFSMTAMELATAAQNQIPVKIILLNNNRLDAIARFGGPEDENMREVVELRNPDFVAFAAAFGIPGAKASADASGEFSEHVKWLVQQEGPALLELQLP